MTPAEEVMRKLILALQKERKDKGLDARSCDCSSGGATITTNTDGEKRIECIINQMPDNMEITCNTKTIEYKPCFTTIDVKDTVCTDIKKEY